MCMLLKMNRRSLYVLIVVGTGLTYFIYALKSTVDIRFDPLVALIAGNTTNSSSLVMFENDSSHSQNIAEPVPAVSNHSTNSNSTGNIKSTVPSPSQESPVAKEPLAQTSNQTSSVQDNGNKLPSVVQHIAPKPGNNILDAIVQGVKTGSLYDSGFMIPSVDLCPDFGASLEMLIIVTSAPQHTTARMAIRQTWGHFNQRRDIAIAFLVGRTAVPAMQLALTQEADLYADIVQSNCVDSYNNLTLKTIAALEWTDTYCGHVRFLLKTDDDMFINVPKLLTFLTKHTHDRRKIFGRLAKKWKPIRNKASKYYVSPQQYKHPVFPDFLTGPAYVMTGDVVHDLYETALEKTYLKLEDVYTTGIVAQDRKIQRLHINEFFNRRVTLNACNVQKGISIHMVKTHEQYDLWKKLLDGRSKC